MILLILRKRDRVLELQIVSSIMWNGVLASDLLGLYSMSLCLFLIYQYLILLVYCGGDIDLVERHDSGEMREVVDVMDLGAKLGTN